jgi:AraC family transcriptional regulator of adaptative response/methylated-DNA-[protein]-cysteine methyltransferase
MTAAASDAALCLLEFSDRRMLATQKKRVEAILDSRISSGRNDVIDSIEAELGEYFEGRLTRFETPIVMSGKDFQRSVWGILLRIPFGETRTYGAIAHALGNPGAVRAVGRANGDNRIAIVIPCHRVVGEDGALTGYGGGLHRKRRLLELERSVASRSQPGIGPLFEQRSR